LGDRRENNKRKTVQRMAGGYKGVVQQREIRIEKKGLQIRHM